MRWLVSFWILWAVSVQAAFVETRAGRRIDGVALSASADGAVTLVTANGQKMTFRPGQYRRAVADKPRELAQAERLLKEGRGDEAVALLETVKSRYRFLSWDQKAIGLLGNFFCETGQYKRAVAEFQALENPDEATQTRLREALVKAGLRNQAFALLEADIASGSREAAARAYLLRGELRAQAGDREGARRDWLKVATFFRAQKDAAKQADGKLGACK